MSLSIQDWHNRFLLQAQWTRALRLYFFDLIKLDPADKILDIGCGTGALLPDLQSLSPAEIYGADLSLAHLQQASQISPESSLFGADVHNLPILDNTFDMILSHYFLMWIGDASHALKEMLRVIKPGGYLVAFAEPDYGGRIDFPQEFTKIRDYQITSLLGAGADPRMGRSLKALFSNAGFSEITCGVYEGYWQEKPSGTEIESEWKVLENDLSGLLSRTEIAVLKDQDFLARENGTRLIYVPTFYCWGKVNKTF